MIKLSTTRLCARDLLKGFLNRFLRKEPIKEFEEAMAGFLKSRKCFAVSSGENAFRLILKTLKRITGANRVIITPYLERRYLGVIEKEGLSCVSCGLVPFTVNPEPEALYKLSEKDTACVVMTHAFGIPVDMSELSHKLRQKNIFMVEDCSRALGSYYYRYRVGSVGDISFTDFSPQANLNLVSGGCIMVNREELVNELEYETRNLEFQGALPEIKMFSKMLVNLFKSGGLNDSNSAAKITRLQAAVGLSVLKNIFKKNVKRLYNGTFLMESTKKNDRVSQFMIPAYCKPVYNLLPLFILKEEDFLYVKKQLAGEGIETGNYTGAGADKKKNIALFPAHEGLKEKGINRIAEVINSL